MVKSQEVMTAIESQQIEAESTDVISKIFFVKNKIESTPVNEWEMTVLMDYIFTLCKLMYNLSDLKDYAYVHAEALSEQYKSEVRDEYIKLKNGAEKMTDGMAKALAEKSADKTKQEELQAIHKARWLRSLHSDMDRLISFSQTKSKTMINDKIRSNVSGI